MKLQKFNQKRTVEGKEVDDGVTYVFWCPGCKTHHLYNTGRSTQPVWEFNGDMDKPTFTPSLLYYGKLRCHLFVTDGKIIYQNDCDHELAGKTVDLPDIPSDQLW